jgi:transcription elongation factor
VTVFVTIDEGENPFEAHTYTCDLELKSNDSGSFIDAQSYESEYRADDLSIKAQEGAEFESTVTGDLPTP